MCEIRFVRNKIGVNFIENHEKGMKHKKKEPENRIKKKERKGSKMWNDG
jgi:hypothetical protein